MRILGIIIAVAGIALIIVLNVLHVRHYGRFVKYLELNHQEHWKSVGSPAQFDTEPEYGTIGYSAYFASRRYAELGDPLLSELGDKLQGRRKWMYASLCVLVVGVELARRFPN
jgi:hypothetical protein